MSIYKLQKFKIIYEDKEMIICYKTAGLPTQTAEPGRIDLVSLLKKYLAEKEKNKNPYLGVIHRLDQPVAGLLVFAKNKKAAAGLSKQIQEGFVNKDYLALLTGCPKEKRGTLIHYMKKNPQTKMAEVLDEEKLQKMAVETKPDTGQTPNVNEKNVYKKAMLTYEIIREYEDSALARVHLETGRFHQIRAQFAYFGHPLLGDMKYGATMSKELSGKREIYNIALCADRLELKHPVTGKVMTFEAEEADLPIWTKES